MFIYWILYPLLFGATLVGLGLGVRKIGGPFNPALILPVGYCASVIVAAIFVAFSATSWLAAPVMCLLALAGFVFSWAELRAAFFGGGALRRNWFWMVAGLAGFLWFGASAIAAGVPTFTGYNQIVDIASQLNWAQYVTDHGRDPILESLSSSDAHIAGTLPIGYPAGPQAVLGVFPRFFGMNIMWAWQPYLSMAAGLIVLGAYGLLQLVIKNRGFAALGAFATGQASVLIGYGNIGGIKEMTAVATLLCAAALIPTALTSDGKPFWRSVFPFAIGLAGVYSVFSLAIIPWLGLFGLGAFLLVWQHLSLKDAAIRAGTVLVFGVIVTLPTILPSLHSGDFGDRMKTDVGNLATIVSRWTFSGVWFTQDHRFPLEGTARTTSIIVACIIFALAIVGLYVAWKRKQPTLIILSIASLVGMKLILLQFGQWMDLKALCLAAPVSLLMATVGLSSVLESKRKPLQYAAWVGVGGLVFVGLYGGVLRYGAAQLAPHDRLTELSVYNHTFAGTRRSLDPDWDENAGFVMRDANLNQAFNNPYPATPEWDADPAKPKGDQYAWDFDNIQSTFFSDYDLIVMRRSPGQSRPPGQYKQVGMGHYFTVWQKSQLPPATKHLALTGSYDPAEKAKCEAFIKEQEPTATITIAPSPPIAGTVFDPTKVSKSLTLSGDNSVLTNGRAGVALGSVDVSGYSGPFDVFMVDLSHRDASVTIEGHKLVPRRDPSASVRSQYLGTIPLASGTHEVTLKTGGTTLYPGTARNNNMGAWLGTVQLVPRGELYPNLLTTTASDAVCPQSIDWVEAS